MAHKLKLTNILLPQNSPEAITRHQIELDSCSSLLKTRESM